MTVSTRALRTAGVALVVVVLAALSACSSGGSSGSASSAASSTTSGSGSPSGSSGSSAADDTASVPITLLDLPDKLVKPVVEISVGGGPTVKVTLDTGSPGLVISSKALGSGATDTGQPLNQSYGGGPTQGRLVNAPVTLKGSDGGDLTTPPVGIEAIDGDLPLVVSLGGAVGVLGVGPGLYDDAKPPLLSPLASLPGSLADGYLIDVRNKKLTLGAPNPTKKAVTAPLTKEPWTYPNGLPGYSLIVNANWTIDGKTAALPTLFDSGGLKGQWPQNLLAQGGFGTQVSPNSKVSIAVGDNQVVSYTSTDLGLISSSSSGPVMNAGLPSFRENQIGLNLKTGEQVIAPFGNASGGSGSSGSASGSGASGAASPSGS